MVNYFTKKGYKTGLAVGCLLAALCIAGMLGIIFFPHIFGFSLFAISASKALLGCNAFSAALGLMIWQDPTIRRQSSIEWTSTSYPLLFGFIGYFTANIFAGLGKWIGKGMDRISLALNRQPIQPEGLQFNKSTSKIMPSCQRRLASRKIKATWMPAFAGMTMFKTATSNSSTTPSQDHESVSKPATHSNVSLLL